MSPTDCSNSGADFSEMAVWQPANVNSAVLSAKDIGAFKRGSMMSAVLVVYARDPDVSLVFEFKDQTDHDLPPVAAGVGLTERALRDESFRPYA